MWNDNLCRVAWVITWAPVPSELISVVLIYWLSSAGTGVWPMHKETHTPELPQAKENPSADQTSPKETSLCLMCACLWMNVLKCLELKCTRRAGSQAQIKPSHTIKRISREKDQSSCDVTWSHLNDLRTFLKINYLLVIWIICLLSVWLLICMRKQKCLLGKWIIISLKEF